MKKLSLKNLKLDANDLLQREQLKSVFGGYGGVGSCSADCGKDSCGRSVSVTCSGSPCLATDDSGCASTTEAHTCTIAVMESNKTCPRF